MLVSRYFRNGLQDNGFGRRGFWTVTLGRGSTDAANALAVDAKGGILAAGSSTHNCGGTECTSLLLARLGKDGHPVRSFGHGGIVTPPIGSGAAGHPAFETAYEVAARPQGKILVGGLVGGPSGSRFFLRRYLADGTPDNSFGTARPGDDAAGGGAGPLIEPHGGIFRSLRRRAVRLWRQG